MTPVGEFFAIALGVVLAFAVVPRDRILTLGAWVILLLSWVVTMIVAHNGPDRVFIYAAFDALAGTGAAAAYGRTRARWLMVLAMLFAASSMTHVLWYALQAIDPAPDRLARYYIVINVVYILQLFTVAGPGAYRGMVDLFRMVLGPAAPGHSKGAARE